MGCAGGFRTGAVGVESLAVNPRGIHRSEVTTAHVSRFMKTSAQNLGSGGQAQPLRKPFWPRPNPGRAAFILASLWAVCSHAEET